MLYELACDAVMHFKIIINQYLMTIILMKVPNFMYKKWY